MDCRVHGRAQEHVYGERNIYEKELVDKHAFPVTTVAANHLAHEETLVWTKVKSF
jgi:hypothetical protein